MPKTADFGVLGSDPRKHASGGRKRPPGPRKHEKTACFSDFARWAEKLEKRPKSYIENRVFPEKTTFSQVRRLPHLFFLWLASTILTSLAVLVENCRICFFAPKPLSRHSSPNGRIELIRL